MERMTAPPPASTDQVDPDVDEDVAGRRPVAGDRLERPGQPDVLRHLRAAEALRLSRAQGDRADARRAPQGQGRGVVRATRTRSRPTSRSCTPPASGPPCRRPDADSERLEALRPRGAAAARRARWRRRRPRCCAGWSPRSGRCSPARADEHPARRAGRAHRACAPGRPPRPTTACSPGCCPTSPRDDADLSAGLRSLHEPELIEAKDAAAALVLETLPEAGGRVELTAGAGRRLAGRAERRAAGPGHRARRQRGHARRAAAGRPARRRTSASTTGSRSSRTRWCSRGWPCAERGPRVGAPQVAARSVWPRLRSGATRSRTSCLSRLQLGEAALLAAVPQHVVVEPDGEHPADAGHEGHLAEVARGKLVSSSWAVQPARRSQRHCVQ